MSWFARLPRQKAGHPIRARTINRIAETAEQISKFRVCPPLSLNMSAAGLMLRYLGPLFGVYIVLTDGSGISARSSTTPGTGNVIIQTWNGTVMASSAGPKLPVRNWNVQAIGASKYGVVLLIYGSYWAIAFEC